MIEITDEMLFKYAPIAEAELFAAENMGFDESPGFEPSIRFEKKMKKLLRHAKRPARHYRLMNRIGRMATLVFGTAGGLATATVGVHAVRQFTYNVWEIEYPDNVEYRFDSEGTGTTEIREPTYIPEGYELIWSDDTMGDLDIYYENEDGESIFVSEANLENDPMIAFGTDNVEWYDYEINGFEATMEISTDDNSKVIRWIDGNIYFYVSTSDTTVGELLKIANSLYENMY